MGKNISYRTRILKQAHACFLIACKKFIACGIIEKRKEAIIMQLIKNQDQLEFVVFCIENVALKLNIDPLDIYRLFLKKSIIEYLTTNYDVLHSLSKDYIVNDIMIQLYDKEENL